MRQPLQRGDGTDAMPPFKLYATFYQPLSVAERGIYADCTHLSAITLMYYA